MKEVGTPELNTMINRGEDLTLINTLHPKKFRITHIPGSENIPADDPDFAEKVEKHVGSKEKTVVLYCADSTCDSSTKAARQLEEAGFTDVYDYTGGAKAWQAAGGTLVIPTAETP